jgi:putative membrane protein
MQKLSHEDSAKIHAALRAAQARTDARLALMIVPVSDRYALYPLVFAGALALAVGGALAFFWQDIGLQIAFLIEAATFGVTAIACDVQPVKLALVPRTIKEASARVMAHREFAAGILAAQDHKDGLLFFASLGERYVEIVASRDLHARVGEEAWNRIVAAFSESAKHGRLVQAFVDAIEACAQHLETHYPASAAA